MTDDDRYFGYTSSGNADLQHLRWVAAHMGDDIIHYEPYEGSWPRGEPTPEPARVNEPAVRANNSVEVIYDRIMALQPDLVAAIAARWTGVATALGHIKDRVRDMALQLKYGRDGTQGGPEGWMGAAAAAFLRRGPGATLKSLEQWEELAQRHAEQTRNVAVSIGAVQELMKMVYERYLRAMRDAHYQFWGRDEETGLPTGPGGQLLDVGESPPPPGYSIAGWQPSFRAQYYDHMALTELRFRPEAMRLQWHLAEKFREAMRNSLRERGTRYEGPTNAIMADGEALFRMAHPPPSFPGVGAPAAPPSPPLPGTATIPVPPTPAPPSSPSTPAPPSPSPPRSPSAPPLPGTSRVPGTPGAPAPTVPAGGRVASSAPPTVSPVLRGGPGADALPNLGQQGQAPPMPPPARPPQRPRDPGSTSPAVVGPQPEEFATPGTPPPPVLRSPRRHRIPPVPQRSAGTPPSLRAPGAAPPVLGRPPAGPPQRTDERERSEVQAGAGVHDEFAPPTPPGPPVLQRSRATGDPGPLPAPVAGVRKEWVEDQGEVLARRPAADAEPEAPVVDEASREAFRALILYGEAAFTVRTPGGGIVGGGTPQRVEASAEPKPALGGSS